MADMTGNNHPQSSHIRYESLISSHTLSRGLYGASQTVWGIAGVCSSAVGVGLMENPSLMKRGEFYYWHESSNGTVRLGIRVPPPA